MIGFILTCQSAISEFDDERRMRVRVVIDPETGLHRLIDEVKNDVEEMNSYLSSLHLRGLSELTIRSYAYDLLTLRRWMIGTDKDISVSELTERDLVDFVASQRKVGARPRSINRRLSTIRTMYRYLTGDEMKTAPAINAPGGYYRGPGRDKDLGIQVLKRRRRLVVQVKVPRTIVEPLTPEEVRKSLGGFRRYRDLTIVYFMLFCGLRSREVLALNLSDVNTSESRIVVHGKGDKDRTLPLPEITAEVLQLYLLFERPKRCETDALFVAIQGKNRGCRMTPSGLRSLFRYWRKNLENGRANPHRFRHTFGTDMARAGVPLEVLKKLMGHASSDTTSHYVNLAMSDVAEEHMRALKNIEKRYR